MKTHLNKEWVTLFKVLGKGYNISWSIEINRNAPAGFPFKKTHHFYIRDATGGCKAIAAETETILSDGKWYYVAWVVKQAEKRPSKFIHFKEPVFVGEENNRGKLARPESRNGSEVPRPLSTYQTGI